VGARVADNAVGTRHPATLTSPAVNIIIFLSMVLAEKVIKLRSVELL
jgi:hypothetical protein